MFSIEPEQLRESGQELSTTGDGLSTELGRIRSDVAGHASDWGTDEPGALCGADYQEASELAAQALAAMARGIAAVGEALADTADDTEANDQAHADDLKRLLDEVGSVP